MSNLTVKSFFNSDMAQQKLQELVGKNASSFATAVLQVVNSNDMLKNADPVTVFTAACTAATLNLPINNTLGFAYIVPFYNGKTRSTEAQFMIGAKGFVQLAQRSGQFKTIKAVPTYSGDDDDSIMNRLTSFKPRPPVGEVDGYIAYFKLINGFEAHLHMSLDELQAHAKKYSKTYSKGFGVWKDNFDAMAQKTVIKLLLSKQAPLSIDMPLMTALDADQSVMRDVEGTTYDYPDNEGVTSTQAIEMDISNDAAMFENVKRGIEAGNIDKVAVLQGTSGYRLSDQQLEIVRGL